MRATALTLAIEAGCAHAGLRLPTKYCCQVFWACRSCRCRLSRRAVCASGDLPMDIGAKRSAHAEGLPRGWWSGVVKFPRLRMDVWGSSARKPQMSARTALLLTEPTRSGSRQGADYCAARWYAAAAVSRMVSFMHGGACVVEWGPQGRRGNVVGGEGGGVGDWVACGRCNAAFVRRGGEGVTTVGGEQAG